ncbi:MAG: PD40 domain-containing protein [Solirubrobacterales bacterium]|nr:PD40 domain-containing protein [Solirubrobacterales bacterium]MCB0860452.1 PD40 domain-containing protein [Solirubrobacterales bacterium]HRV59527.1 hypothetical protein [Solirubrobacterales bacterium]
MKQMKLVTLFFFAAALAATPLVASADEPAPAGKSRLVFSSGGRIVTVKSDGSGRRVLTRKGKVSGRDMDLFSSGETYDRAPQVSPGGKRILFFRQSDYGRYTEGTSSDFYIDGKTMVMPAAGGKAHRVLGPEKKMSSLRDATWIPGSRNLLAVRRYFKDWWARNSVVVVRPDGKVLRTILSFREPRRYSESSTYYLATELSVSPDGNSFLMTRQDTRYDSSSRLELVNLETGKRRVVRNQAREGEFSPDGSGIVFAAGGSGPEVCYQSKEDCRQPYDLYVAGSDGSGVHRVTRTGYDERSPSFSSDGQQIAFSANKNRPAADLSREVYRINADGTCLNWLTNGSPASADPDWGPGAVAASACAPSVRKPLVEGNPGRLDIRRWGPRVWLGKSYDGALLSSSLTFFGLSLVDYRDCGTFKRVDCAEPVTVAQVPICLVGNFLPSLLQVLNNRKLRKNFKLRYGRTRGIGFRTGYARGFSLSIVFSGQRMILTMQRSGGARSGRIDQIALIRKLRDLGADAGGRLPVFGVPVSALQSYRQARRAVRKFGRREAAKRLEINRWQLRANLRFRANLRRVGPAKPIGCGGFKGIGDLFGDASSSTRAARTAVRTANSPVVRSLTEPLLNSVLLLAEGNELPRGLLRSLP